MYLLLSCYKVLAIYHTNETIIQDKVIQYSNTFKRITKINIKSNLIIKYTIDNIEKHNKNLSQKISFLFDNLAMDIDTIITASNNTLIKDIKLSNIKVRKYCNKQKNFSFLVPVYSTTNLRNLLAKLFKDYKNDIIDVVRSFRINEIEEIRDLSTQVKYNFIQTLFGKNIKIINLNFVAQITAILSLQNQATISIINDIFIKHQSRIKNYVSSDAFWIRIISEQEKFYEFLEKQKESLLELIRKNEAAFVKQLIINHEGCFYNILYDYLKGLTMLFIG